MDQFTIQFERTPAAAMAAPQAHWLAALWQAERQHLRCLLSPCFFSLSIFLLFFLCSPALVPRAALRSRLPYFLFLFLLFCLCRIALLPWAVWGSCRRWWRQPGAAGDGPLAARAAAGAAGASARPAFTRRSGFAAASSSSCVSSSFSSFSSPSCFGFVCLLLACLLGLPGLPSSSSRLPVAFAAPNFLFFFRPLCFIFSSSFFFLLSFLSLLRLL